MLSRFNKKTREKAYRAFVWVFLTIFVFSVAAASVLTLMGRGATPTK